MKILFSLFVFLLFANLGLASESTQSPIDPQHFYAVLVKTSQELAHQNNQRAFYQMLRQMGVPKKNIIVVNSALVDEKQLSWHFRKPSRGPRNTQAKDHTSLAIALETYLFLYDFDGDGKSDIDFDLSAEAISEAILEVLEMDEEDKVPSQVFVYLNGHGEQLSSGDGSVILEKANEEDRYTGSDLDWALSYMITQDTQVAILIQACMSGSFAQTCNNSGRILLTSAGTDNSSYMGESEGAKCSIFSENLRCKIAEGFDLASAFEEVKDDNAPQYRYIGTDLSPLDQLSYEDMAYIFFGRLLNLPPKKIVELPLPKMMNFPPTKVYFQETKPGDTPMWFGPRNRPFFFPPIRQEKQ